MPSNFSLSTSNHMEDQDGFWSKIARNIDWIKPFAKVKNVKFQQPGRIDQMV